MKKGTLPSSPESPDSTLLRYLWWRLFRGWGCKCLIKKKIYFHLYHDKLHTNILTYIKKRKIQILFMSKYLLFLFHCLFFIKHQSNTNRKFNYRGWILFYTLWQCWIVFFSYPNLLWGGNNFLLVSLHDAWLSQLAAEGS